MKTIRIQQKRRKQGRLKSCRERISLPLVLMAFGYLLCCLIGIFVAINADAEWLRNLSDSLVAKQSSGLFTVFCGCASYGIVMLFLATSYLGFALIPGVLSLKGFLSASVFTASIRGDLPHGIEQSLIWLIFPGLFLLPAMLILGGQCMHWSVRLFCCRAGELIPPDPSATRAIGTALVLLLAASAVKAYLVPYVLNLF